MVWIDTQPYPSESLKRKLVLFQNPKDREVRRCKLDPSLKARPVSKVQPNEDKFTFILNLVSELAPLQRGGGWEAELRARRRHRARVRLPRCQEPHGEAGHRIRITGDIYQNN